MDCPSEPRCIEVTLLTDTNLGPAGTKAIFYRVSTGAWISGYTPEGRAITIKPAQLVDKTICKYKIIY